MTTTAQTGEHVTVAEAATLLGVHQNTIRNRIKSGHIPAEKVLTPYGEAFAIPRAHIDEALQAPPHRPLPNPSHVGGRVPGGSNDLLPLSYEQNGEVSRGSDPTSVTLTTPTIGTLTTIMQQVITPLTEMNERQAGEIAALHSAMRQQAEELGRERGRREAVEQEAERLRRAQRSRPWWIRLFLG